ncbi:hypothetical protein ACN23B_27665 (plasmid) [Anabaena sp. FACHB-709]|uniref:Helix-turn-helix domain-containing protein n=2 Tax=Nostocaceae TaxID=1162 RepID=A0A1Z4KWV8_ANAVA|nr:MULTISPECIES: hypothetical protein [Nostocaceae]BAY72670.1 hypothetical protein NIES23_54980 [Trichormus variabilis NIES-23]MBD2174373.1 hypothetical protein [Anabaena cylindrica FACHB-318]MBD2266144.1 hypothetical protein [Anabaena sp. FACHB-709]MBD2275554.1 hypothetical protein [Nostoc sp. PCC 7120 = FACHB-418]MBD2286458.1 hypothetical protein [Anabaena cylindrica FACHB-170]
MSKQISESHNYKCHQIANILHLNLSTVRLWINRGWLKANKRCPKYYEISISHLKEFLENPPHQIQKRIASLDSQTINYLFGKKV